MKRLLARLRVVTLAWRRRLVTGINRTLGKTALAFCTEDLRLRSLQSWCLLQKEGMDPDSSPCTIPTVVPITHSLIPY